MSDTPQSSTGGEIPAKSQEESKSSSPLPSWVPSTKVMAMIICAVGFVVLLFCLIALPTRHWNSGEVTLPLSGVMYTFDVEVGLAKSKISGHGYSETMDNTGDLKDRGNAAIGLISTAVVLVAIGIGGGVIVLLEKANSIMALVGAQGSHLALAGTVVAALAWLLQMCGWAQWVDNYDKKLNWSFFLAIVAWIFLNLWIVVWVVVYLQLKAEDGAGAEDRATEAPAPTPEEAPAPTPELGLTPSIGASPEAAV